MALASLGEAEKTNERTNSMVSKRTNHAMNLDKMNLDKLFHEFEHEHEKGEESIDFFLNSPYRLEELNIDSHFYEQNVEEAIILDMKAFFLELGDEFTFVERSKCCETRGKPFFITLLFFHRKLQRLVCIKLKTDDFKPIHKSQMHEYLQWIDANERFEQENKTIGIVLCTGRDVRAEEVKLFELQNNEICDIECLADFPSKDVLQKQLRVAIERARDILE